MEDHQHGPQCKHDDLATATPAQVKGWAKLALDKIEAKERAQAAKETAAKAKEAKAAAAATASAKASAKASATASATKPEMVPDESLADRIEKSIKKNSIAIIHTVGDDFVANCSHTIGEHLRGQMEICLMGLASEMTGAILDAAVHHRQEHPDQWKAGVILPKGEFIQQLPLYVMQIDDARKFPAHFSYLIGHIDSAAEPVAPPAAAAAAAAPVAESAKPPIPVLQLVWPNVKGKFPWELQPLLGKSPVVSSK